MFEARLAQGKLFKMIIAAMAELVTDCNLDCSATGISLQAMDSSHVSLCCLLLRADCFDHYRCDRTISLGLNIPSVAKILKCAGNDDIITLKAEDKGDDLTLVFESKNQDRISDFKLTLMDIDSEHLGIPETEYKCTVKMPSVQFQQICRDLQVLGEACVIACDKQGIRFSAEGDLGKGNITLKQTTSVDKAEEQVIIEMEDEVSLKFALQYLSNFTRATPLSAHVKLSMSPDVPILVEYPIGMSGYMRYYLAPRIGDDEEGGDN